MDSICPAALARNLSVKSYQNTERGILDLYNGLRGNHMFLTFIVAQFLLGLFGNALGFFVACHPIFRTKRSINAQLTKYLFTLNFVNTLCMIPYPLIHFLASPALVGSIGWKFYLLKIHFLTVKLLKTTSFLVSFLFCMYHVLAVTYPMFYKRNIDHRFVVYTFVFIILYGVCWLLPMYWLLPTTLNEPHSGPDHEIGILELKVWNHFRYCSTPRWKVYALTRESVIKYLPFLVQIGFKIIAIYKTHHLFLWNVASRPTKIPSTLRDETSPLRSGPHSEGGLRPLSANTREKANYTNVDEPIALSELQLPRTIIKYVARKAAAASGAVGSIAYESEGLSDSDIEAAAHSSVRSLTSTTTSKTSKKSNKAITKSSTASSIISSRNARKRIEIRKNFKLLISLVLEFLVFMLPISLYNMTMLFKSPKPNSQSEGAGSSLLEPNIKVWYALQASENMYIVLTFYMNVCFNLCYRENFILIFKEYHKKWKKLLTRPN